MIAFDADVLSDILLGSLNLSRRAAVIPVHDQFVPIVVVEEILRGRLNSIRQAEAGKVKLSVSRAYELLEQSLNAFRQVLTLPYTPKAEELYEMWRPLKLRIGTHDLRIAAICVVHSATLVTRNERDFAQIPGLGFEVWN